MLKKMLAAVGFIVILIAMSIGGQIGKEVGKSAFSHSKLTQQEIDQIIIKGFKKGAQRINKNTPIMVDKGTRMDRATVGPGALTTYHYTLLEYSSHDLDADWLRQQLRPIVKNGVCNKKDMKKSLQYGGVYAYSYSGNDEVWISRFEINRNDCGFQKITP